MSEVQLMRAAVSTAARCCACYIVCLFAPRNLRGLKSYDHEIWHVGPLSDRKPQCSIRILIFGRKPVLWAQTPFFGFFGLFKD